MQKWEYCSLHSGDFSSLIFYKSNGAVKISLEMDSSKGDKSDHDAFVRTIAALGLAGWELVSRTAGMGSNPEFFFKRTLP
jgi:hypothetical protein